MISGIKQLWKLYSYFDGTPFSILLLLLDFGKGHTALCSEPSSAMFLYSSFGLLFRSFRDKAMAGYHESQN
jgi:hypothetical protein